MFQLRLLFFVCFLFTDMISFWNSSGLILVSPIFHILSHLSSILVRESMVIALTTDPSTDPCFIISCTLIGLHSPSSVIGVRMLLEFSLYMSPVLTFNSFHP